MSDIAKVAWLPFTDAVKKLSYPLEKLFLRNVGRPLVRRKHKDAANKPGKKAKKKAKRKAKKHAKRGKR
jgi:hypothetical protein